MWLGIHCSGAYSLLWCSLLDICSLDCPHTNPVYDECEYVYSGSVDVVLEDMTKNPAYETAREAVTNFTFGHQTERNREEDSHTYEMMPFEGNREGQSGTTCGSQEGAVDDMPIYANQ